MTNRLHTQWGALAVGFVEGGSRRANALESGGQSGAGMGFRVAHALGSGRPEQSRGRGSEPGGG